jgi:predicted dehydrogenase
MSKVKVVVVGLNYGRNVVEELMRDGGNPHVQLVGLCDLDRAKAEALAAKHGELPVYDDLDAVLADPGVDGVGLYCGPSGRAALLSKIIKAGKDVMTTKPFETDVVAAEAVLAEGEALGRVIHLNSPNPGTSPDLAVIAKWREQFDLGMPVAARAETWTHYRDQADGSWYDDPARCPVAPVFRLGIYMINDLVRVFGRARRVSVLQSRLFTKRPTPDNAQVAIEFGSGALANVFASFCVRDGDHYRDGAILNFERGTIYRNVGPERGESLCELSVVVNDGDWEPRRIAAQSAVDIRSGLYDWAGFAAAVRGDAGAPGYDVEEILEPLRIVNAMAKAAESEKVELVER